MGDYKYKVYWNPDGRFNYGHWSVSVYNRLSEHGGISSGMSYNYLSDAIRHPTKMLAKHPETTTVIFPDAEQKEIARKYYGSVLNGIFENNGLFIGC